MKIFANIPTFFKAYGNLPQLTQFKKEIEKAKVAGDLEREKEYILKATSTWGKSLSKSIGMDLELLGSEKRTCGVYVKSSEFCRHNSSLRRFRYYSIRIHS